MKLPEGRRSREDVMRALRAFKKDDFAWIKGRLPLYIYYLDDDLLNLQCQAFSEYMVENGHGKLTVFPSVQRMESDVIDMCLDLFSAPSGSTGTFTSGGTESILLAVKTARDWARVNRSRVARPAMILPASAHPAFSKAAHYFGVEEIRVPLSSNYKADILAIRSAITDRVIFMVGSAPTYPHGVFDPIGSLAELANENGIWFHVDACFGGFLAPFAKEIGYPVPPFDFAVPGVWSISADLHKYGFAAKGASFFGLRNNALREYQEFRFSNWGRGNYVSPGIPGSRPAGSVAAAWAVMNHLGRTGYRDLASRTMRTRDRLIEGVEGIPSITCALVPELSIVVIGAENDTVKIPAVAAGLQERGWFASRSSNPVGLHFTVNPVHEAVIDEYLEDLAWSVRTATERQISEHSENSTY